MPSKTTYYDNGHKFERNFKNNKQDGLSTSWYKNGQKKL
jgi:antitoxin component YwqK of YwqJK toxin-antitoxin module